MKDEEEEEEVVVAVAVERGGGGGWGGGGGGEKKNNKNKIKLTNIRMSNTMRFSTYIYVLPQRKWLLHQPSTELKLVFVNIYTVVHCDYATAPLFKCKRNGYYI